MKPGRAVLAMNVLGDDWVSELAKHPPENWFTGALDAYLSFESWLWIRIVNAPIEDAYGRQRADGYQLEAFRRTLPPFEVFQAWYNREEHQGGLKLRVAGLTLKAAMEPQPDVLLSGIRNHVKGRYTPETVFNPESP